MLIYNTTFHCETSCSKEFIMWMRQQYVPHAMKYKGLSDPRFARILSSENDEGESYSIQFRTPDLETLSDWYNNCGVDVHKSLEAKFGNKVAGFSTILFEIDLE